MPDHQAGTGAAEPDDVRTLVAIQVASASDAEARFGRAQDEPDFFDQTGGIQIPDGGLLGRLILPQDVGVAVLIEVGHSGGRPAGETPDRRAGEKPVAVAAGEIPDHDPARGRLRVWGGAFQQQVGMPVVIQVREAHHSPAGELARTADRFGMPEHRSRLVDHVPGEDLAVIIGPDEVGVAVQVEVRHGRKFPAGQRSALVDRLRRQHAVSSNFQSPDAGRRGGMLDEQLRLCAHGAGCRQQNQA